MHSQTYTQVYCGSCFTNTTFLIAYSNRVTVGHLSCSSFFGDFIAACNERLCICPQYLSSTPPAAAFAFRETLGSRCAAPCHRAFTSAGFSASSVEKYHYHSDCHRRPGGNPGFRSGVLARPPVRRSHGVSIFGLIIRSNVPSACIFNFQGSRSGSRLWLGKNPFTYSE